MRDTRSVLRGVRAMRRPYAGKHKPGWHVWRCRGWWAEWWTPGWHEGRGPYVTVGLGLFAIARGY